MIGFLLGPDASIPYCSGAADGLGGTGTLPELPKNSPVITYTDGKESGTPFDSISFITSVPVTLNETCDISQQKDCSTPTKLPRIDYFLTTQCESVPVVPAVPGTQKIYADAGSDCFDDIALGDGASKNGRSLVTFDSLLLSAAGTTSGAPQVYYSLNAKPDSTITLNETLGQNIPDGSTFYNVRMYRYVVETTAGMRNLKRVGWDSACKIGADVTSNLVESFSGNTSGGVDGLKFEFITIDSITKQLVTSSTPPVAFTELKEIRIWLLLRSDRSDNDYIDNNTYVLGSVTLGPYKDHYRRLLVNKTVEVKNLASIY
jgi:hypothetical protein